jgi:8-oxo-dGTP diphosphatase
MNQFCYDHPRPAVTVDVACFAEEGGTASILLIQRSRAPFEGRWALPGGFVDEHEALDAAARRELEEETGLTQTEMEQFRAYGDPGRDPRGHTVTVVFLATFDRREPVEGMDDASDARWFTLDSLPALAFDHDRVIAEAFDAWKRRQGRG